MALEFRPLHGDFAAEVTEALCAMLPRFLR